MIIKIYKIVCEINYLICNLFDKIYFFYVFFLVVLSIDTSFLGILTSTTFFSEKGVIK